jgi:large subunit ribosomal protein L25
LRAGEESQDDEPMAAESLTVTTRKQLGSAHTRRLRKAGAIPAILYGHGEASVSLVLVPDELRGVIRRGGKLVRLQGDVTESAFIKAVQWDVYGKSMLHVDLLRISESEKVTTTVTVELKGTSPGVSEGGIIEHLVHEVEIDCPAGSVPEKLIVSISNLHLDGAIHAREITLPEGAEMLTDSETVIVHCVPPHEAPEEGAAAVAEPGSVEPELIRKEKADEEGAEE